MDNPQSIDMNLNAAQCLHSSDSFGHETIYNICKGTTYVIPWGSSDWALEIIRWIFLIAITSFLILGARWLWRNA